MKRINIKRLYICVEMYFLSPHLSTWWSVYDNYQHSSHRWQYPTISTCESSIRRIYPIYLKRARYVTRLIVILRKNWFEFSFLSSRAVTSHKLKNPVCLTIYPELRGDRWIHFFLNRIRMKWNKQSHPGFEFKSPIRFSFFKACSIWQK